MEFGLVVVTVVAVLGLLFAPLFVFGYVFDRRRRARLEGLDVPLPDHKHGSPDSRTWGVGDGGGSAPGYLGSGGDGGSGVH